MASILISPYLDELTANIRARPIPWEGYQRANLISEDEIKKIKAVDKQPLAEKTQIISKQSQEYARLILDLLGRMKRVDILQYTLVLAGDFISESKEFAQALLSSSNDKESPYSPFIKLVHGKHFVTSN